MEESIKYKHCKCCGDEKPITEFSLRLDKNGKYYPRSMCKQCKREQDRQYNTTHKDIRIEYQQTITKDKRREYSKKFHDKAKGFYNSSPVYFKICPITNKLFTARRSTRKYSDEGIRIIINKRSKIHSLKNRNKDRYRQCKVCGTTFDVIDNGHRLCCSDKCQNEYVRTYRRLVNKPKDRAKYYGVHYESVNRLKVFERDKWKCQICGIHTPKQLMGKCEDNTPELDHIIPISKGGDHTYNNTQLLCRKCNSIKSDKLVGQQVLMFTHPPVVNSLTGATK